MDKTEFIEIKDKQSINLIADMAHEIWQEHYTDIIGKNQVNYMLKKFQSAETISEQIKEGYKYYLINNSGLSSGYLSIQFNEDFLFLSKLYLKACCRGMGLGKKAVGFIEHLARKQKINKIRLTVNKQNINSIKAYKKLGFIIIDSVVNDIGSGFVMDDYIMEKTVTIDSGLSLLDSDYRFL